MCLLFETIKIENGRPCHLPWHLMRIRRSMEALFGCSVPFIPPGDKNNNGISPLLIGEELDMFHLPKELYKCRMIYTLGIIDIQIAPYKKKNPQTFRLIECDEADYKFKFLDRADIEELYNKRDGADDIIIVKNGYITDTSVANLVFFDGKQYLTPDTPLLEGTCRARLIDEKKIIPARITPQDLKKFRSFQPINAMCEDGFDDMIEMKHVIVD
jgi:4-amino-4-deoxychorismate lyase